MMMHALSVDHTTRSVKYIAEENTAGTKNFFSQKILMYLPHK